MTKQELAEEIWNHPDSKVYRNDWQRWTTSSYHTTERMDLDTLIASALEMVDLGLPEFYENQFLKDHSLNNDPSVDRSLIRGQFYQEAESPGVISILAKKLWDRTPRDLRPEPEPSNWQMVTEEWWKKFMGAYINPTNESKEVWLSKNAELFYGTWSDVKPGTFPVCLIDNGPFTAAGIAFSEREFNFFKRPDGRRKKWFIAKIEDLHKVSPELKRYLEVN